MKPSTIETKNNIRSNVKSDNKTPAQAASTPTKESRIAQIRLAAYFLAEKRNFAPGHEMEDWSKAEAIVDSKLSKKH